MPVLQDVGVHEEGLPGSGRALKGERVQVVRFVIRHVPGRAIHGFFPVEVRAQGFGVVEIPAQVVFGEQQGEVLVGFPRAPVFLCDSQLVAVRGDIGVVVGELIRRYAGVCRMRVQGLGVVAFPARGVRSLGIARSLEHRAHVVIAKLSADKAMERETGLERRGSPAALVRWH